MSEPTHVIILCGGMGTRLREETQFMPKPMVEIGNRPILWHIMKHYSAFGFDKFILCLGYRGDTIRRYFLEYGVMNADIAVAIENGKVRHLCNGHDELQGEVILADTGALTGTGGRIKKAERYVEGDIFLATYGDGLSDVDIRKLIEFHLQHGKIATMTGVRPMTRFGQFVVKDQLAVGFQEKPQLDRGWVNGGFFVFSRKIFEYLDEECTLEREPLERLASEGQLAVYQHEGYWRCMDTYREMKVLEEEWQSGKPGWKMW